MLNEYDDLVGKLGDINQIIILKWKYFFVFESAIYRKPGTIKRASLGMSVNWEYLKICLVNHISQALESVLN